MGFDHNNLEKVISSIEKEFGAGTVRKASGVPDIKRIPTGIIELDSLTGGGFAMGRWTHIYGGYMAGKTLVSLHLIREAQKLGYSCAYYDIEKQYNKEWAESIGIDNDKLLVVEGSIIEDTAKRLEALFSVINVHVIDSVAGAISVDELSTEPDEWRPGISSRAWGKVVRRANHHLDKENNMVVLINQVRETFGRMGGEHPTGGRHIEHESSQSLYFRRSTWLYKDKKGILSADATQGKTVHGDSQPDGIEIQVKMNKSRLNDPLTSTRMRLEFGTGGHFDQMWTLVRAAIYHELVQRSGSWYTVPTGEKVQGEAGIREYMEENEEFKEMARKVLFRG